METILMDIIESNDEWDHTKFQIQVYYNPKCINDQIKVKCAINYKKDERSLCQKYDVMLNKNGIFHYVDIDLDYSIGEIESIEYEYELFLSEQNITVQDRNGTRLIDMNQSHPYKTQDFNFNPDIIEHNFEEEVKGQFKQIDKNHNSDDEVSNELYGYPNLPENDPYAYSIPLNNQDRRDSDYLYNDYGIDSPLKNKDSLRFEKEGSNLRNALEHEDEK